MKVMFMGTPDIAVPCLEALIEKHDVVCVVTQPDKPKNRGQKMAMSPVKELALTHNIDVLQPTRFTISCAFFVQSITVMDLSIIEA